MSLNKIETDDFTFEVPDTLYDTITACLDQYKVAQRNTYIPGKVREYAVKLQKESPEKDVLSDCLKRDDENFRETLKSASPENDQMKGTINLHLTPTAQAELARLATIQAENNPDIARLKKEVAGINHSLRSVIETQNNGIIQELNKHTRILAELENKIELIMSK